MKRYLPLVIIVGVLAIALGAGLMLWRSSKQEAGATQPFAQSNSVPSAQSNSDPNQPPGPVNRTPVSQTTQVDVTNAHWRGGADAKVTLEEYGDYQCPPCGALFHDLKTLEREYGDRMRFVFRHYPLSNHVHALIAARAAEAAGLQGKFWEMHDMIYQNQLSWSPAPDARPVFIQYARDLKLDIDRFTRDMDSPEVAARVKADSERGTSLGVNGTPSIFINGRQMNPTAISLDNIRTALDYMLGTKKAK
jgi:protein-disulfide isomerase